MPRAPPAPIVRVVLSVCWAAYLSAFGLTGFPGRASHRSLQLLAAGLLAVNLASVLWRARSTRQWLGFVLSAVGTAAILLQLRQGLPTAPLGTGLVILGSLVSAQGQRPWEWLSRMKSAHSSV